MFLSEWREVPSAPYLAGKKTDDSSRLDFPSELVSFLVGLMTYQHPGMGGKSVQFKSRHIFFSWYVIKYTPALIRRGYNRLGNVRILLQSDCNVHTSSATL